MEENTELDSEFDAEEIPSPSDLWNYMEHYWHNNREFPENTEDLLKRKADLIEGKVPSSQLPNYVNDILEFESLENLPNPGEKGKIYIITQNNTQFRWSGSEYIQLNFEEYLMTTNTQQDIGVKKWFYTSGGYGYQNHSLGVMSQDGSYPGIAFYRGGTNIGNIVFDGTVFSLLKDDTGTGAYLGAEGYYKTGSNNDYVLTGGGSHKPISDFITETSWNNITGKKWFKTDGGNNWDNNTARIHGINGYDAGLTFYRDGIDVGQIIFDGYNFKTTNSNNDGYKPIISSHFIKNGSDANHVLLGDGEHKPLSDFATSTQLGNYLPLSGGTLTGGGRIRDNGNIYIQQVNVGGNATGLFWETMDDSAFTAGIGAYTENGNFYWNYLGWGAYPWSTATSLAVGDNIFTYKDNRVWHEGNLEDYHNYGLGTVNPVYTPDLNNVTHTSIQDIFDNTLNRPPDNFGYGSVWTHRKSATEFTQMAVNVLTGRLYTRGWSDGTGDTGWKSYLQNGSAIQIDGSGGINNGSDSRSNRTWFDYNWAGTGYAGSVINFSGLGDTYNVEIFAHYGSSSTIGFRTKNGDTGLWGNPQLFWHNGNFDPGNYLTNRGNWHNALLAKTDNPNSVTEYADDPSITGFKTTWGTSLHIKGNGPWYNRLDFNTNGRLDWWQGINTTDMTYNGQIAVIPDGIINWTSNSFNPNTKVNNLEFASGIGFSQSGYPTNDGSIYPYIYHENAGSNTSYIALATQDFVNYRLNTKVDKSGDIMTGGLTISTPDSIGSGNLGILPQNYKLFLSNGAPNYGTVFWTEGTGQGYIQQQRSDGAATAYRLNLQPYGGELFYGDTEVANHLWVNTNFIPKSHSVYHVTQEMINNWNNAYSWGNHAAAGYTTQYWVESQDYANNSVVDEKIHQLTREFFDPVYPVYIENKFTTIIRTEEYAGIPIDIDGELIPTGNISIINLSEKPLEILRSGKHLDTVLERTTAEYYITNEHRILRKGAYKSAELLA